MKRGSCKPGEYLCHGCRKVNRVPAAQAVKDDFNVRCNYCGKPLLEVLQERHRFENGNPTGQTRLTREKYRELLDGGKA